MVRFGGIVTLNSFICLHRIQFGQNSVGAFLGVDAVGIWDERINWLLPTITLMELLGALLFQFVSSSEQSRDVLEVTF